MNIEEILDEELGRLPKQKKPTVQSIIDEELPEAPPMPDFAKLAEAMMSGVQKKAPRQ